MKDISSYTYQGPPCPNCGQPMRTRSGEYTVPDFSGTAEDWEMATPYEICTCTPCGIERVNGAWHVPEDLQPSDKQKKMILFINGRLNLGLEPVTKRQCWLDTQKYYESARSAYNYHMY